MHQMDFGLKSTAVSHSILMLHCVTTWTSSSNPLNDSHGTKRNDVLSKNLLNVKMAKATRMMKVGGGKVESKTRKGFY